MRSLGLMITDARGGGLGGALLDCANAAMLPIVAVIAQTRRAQGRGFMWPTD